MKKIIVLILVLLTAAFFSWADYKITFESKTDGYYYGGVNHPEEVYSQVVWVGKEKLSYITDARRVVVDLKSGRLAVILTGMKKYTVTELPFTISGILPDNLVKYLASVETRGTVQKKEGKKKIGKYHCDIFESSTWIMYQGDKVNEVDTMFYVIGDTGFDLAVYHQANKHLRVLRNYGPAFIGELEKLKGLPVYTESFFYPKGFAVKNASTLKSLEELNPPDGIYTIPQGFEKVEKLSMQEFRAR